MKTSHGWKGVNAGSTDHLMRSFHGGGQDDDDIGQEDDAEDAAGCSVPSWGSQEGVSPKAEVGRQWEK